MKDEKLKKVGKTKNQEDAPFGKKKRQISLNSFEIFEATSETQTIVRS